MHLYGEYALTTTATTSTQFTVRSNSLLRVSMRSLTPSNVVLRLRKDNQLVASSTDSLLQDDVKPGRYELEARVFTGNSSQLEASTYFFVELAISTLDSVTYDIKHGPLKNDCRTSLRNLVISPDPATGNFHKSLTYYLSTKSQHQQGVLASAAFDVDRDSAIISRVGFNFLLDEVDIRVLGSQNVSSELFVNSREVHSLLPPGSYYFEITRPSSFSPSNSKLEHCAEVALSISIRDARFDNGLVDCAHIGTLPWSLDPVDRAGSATYGGPMSGGVVHLFGKFMFPRPGEASVQSMRFTIHEPSAVSVLLQDHDASTSVALVDSEDQPTEVNVARQYLQVYVVHPPQRQQHFLQLQFNEGALEEMWQRCPSYNLHFDVVPVSSVEAHILLCPSRALKLPNPNLNIRRRGYSEYLFTKLSGVAVAEALVVTFNVSKNSVMSTSVGFNSLVSFVSFEVTGDTEDGFTRYESSLHAAQFEHQLITASSELHEILRPGTYELLITTDVFTHLLPATNDSICFPLEYALDVFPEQFIVLVTPTGGADLLPNKDLILRIEFSELVYDRKGTLQGCDDSMLCNLSGIQDAFYLLNRQKETQAVPCTNVESLGSSIFMLTFRNDQILGGASYILQLREDVLFDDLGESIRVPTSHRYSFLNLTDCGSHGFLGDDNECECFVGYASAEGICDVSLICLTAPC